MDTALEFERLNKEVDLAICQHYTALNPKGELLNPVGSTAKHLPVNHPERIKIENDELEEFIHAAYGISFPKKTVTPGHRAPFHFIADLFYERIKNALGFANRTGGKTYAVAVLNHLDMTFKPGCEIASAGAVLDQASKCYRYFTGFLERDWFVDYEQRYLDTTSRSLKTKSIQSWTSFDTGSVLEVITGSEKGLRSPHPHKARIDEIDLMEWSILQTGLSMAQTSNGIRGQNVFTSTRQRENGPMNRLLETAAAKGIEIYEWNIWESVEQCNRRCLRDPVFGTCPIFNFCRGKAHHSDGFYKIDDFVDKVRIIDTESFETEWLNSKPSRHKDVYPMFEPSKHVMTPAKLLKMFGVQSVSAQWQRISGLDFGSSPGHPFVYLKVCMLPNGAFLIFHEYVAEQRLLRDHAQNIVSSPHFLSSETIYADHDRQDNMELKQYGVRTRPAVKDVLPGIDLIKSLLSGFPPSEEPQIYVWYTCKRTIAEFSLYRWQTNPDGTPKKNENPEKEDDHCMDALRYAIFSHKRKVKSGYRATTIVGI